MTTPAEEIGVPVGRMPIVDLLLAFTACLVGDTVEGETPHRCGFILRRNGRLLLITAAHGINGRCWHLELRAPKLPGFPDHPHPTAYYTVNDFYYFEAESLKAGERGYADFAFALIEQEAIELILDGKEGFPKGTNLFMGYDGVIERPNAEGHYSFAALSKVQLVPSMNLLDREPLGQLGMKYDGNETNGLCRFIVQGLHHGDLYKGTSGAPIINGEGKVVAIVQGGDPGQKLILGFPLADFMPTVERILAAPADGET